ncbi:carboxylic acid reductase [Nocardia thailandica]
MARDNDAAARLSQRIEALYAADAQIRAARPLPEVQERLGAPGLSVNQLITTVMTGYADRPAVGTRRRDGRTLLPDHDLLTYAQLWERAGAIAAAWHADGVRPGDFVVVIGFTSAEYLAIDLAVTHLGAVVVPLTGGVSPGRLRAILDETEPAVLAVDHDNLPAALAATGDGGGPRSLLLFDHREDDDTHAAALAAARTAAADTGIAVRTHDEVRARGEQAPPAPLFEPEPGTDPLAMLIYTSGSTGTPKGAMYTHRLVADGWRAGRPLAAITLNYLPMSHIAARLTLISTLTRGGTAYFASAPDMSTLFDDFALVRPTEVFLVPRVCDIVFQRYRREMDSRGTGVDEEALAERVRTELREDLLGGRLMMTICGSAPLAPEMRAFMESVLQLQLHDGYGSTEAGGALLVNGYLLRPPVLDYKLVDVPELGYFATDKPYPRGELLLKTSSMVPGYYKRPDVTAEMFDADGFYRTGDVVAELGPDRLSYVDRRNNVLKLSQGEFVTVSNLEAAYVASPLIRQIYVHGSSERAYLLAVIVPTERAAALPEARLRPALHEELRAIARAAGLESYEIPREFLLEPEPFTIANGLLSGVAKLLRPALKQRYGDRLEQLYADLARGQEDELRALRRDAAVLPVAETVARATRAVLGCAVEDLRPDAHFADLGGDSLAALSYADLLRELLGVDVPVNVVLGPAGDLAGIAAYITRRRAGGARPTPASVHGDGAAEIRAADLTLERFLDHETLTAAADLPAAAPEPRTVLITGANGYLGRFLVLEWLSRPGTRVIALVRGADAAAARDRLLAGFGDHVPAALTGADGPEVLAGDISEPDFGLPEQQWRRLAAEVDLIVHSGALVNHVLPYAQLFGPNVVGTAEVLRLALTTTRKPVAYLSTVAVAAQGESFAEDGDVRVMSPVRTLDASYANGYGNSKWAGEVLLREAADRFGLPVTVFRSDMILAHRTLPGQLNVPDVFTRLLLSVLLTGLAPASFYRTGPDGTRQRAHYDGLPADFVAAAIVALGARTTGYRTYDVVNPHADGIGLDTFVDWLIEAGHPIDRIDDHAAWFERFATALRGLPEQQRRHSLLPVLEVYRHPGRARAGSALPAAGFRDAVRAAGLPGAPDIPHLDPALITKYVTDLRELGLLDPDKPADRAGQSSLLARSPTKRASPGSAEVKRSTS